MSDLYIRRNLREQLQANNTAHRLEDSGEIFARVLVQRVLTSSGWQERIVAQAGADGELVDGDGESFLQSSSITGGVGINVDSANGSTAIEIDPSSAAMPPVIDTATRWNTLQLNQPYDVIPLDSTRIAVVNASLRYVRIIDTATMTVSASADLGAGKTGWNGALGGGSLWVTNSANDLYEINPDDGSVLNTYTLPTDGDSAGIATRDIVYHEGFLYVVNHNGGNVAKINPADGSVITTITVGSVPYGLCVDNGMLYVSNYSSASISVIDLATDTVTATWTPSGIQSPRGLACDGNTLWIANSALPSTYLVIGVDMETGQTVYRVAVPEGDQAYGVYFDGTNIRFVSYEYNGGDNTNSCRLYTATTHGVVIASRNVGYAHQREMAMLNGVLYVAMAGNQSELVEVRPARQNILPDLQADASEWPQGTLRLHSDKWRFIREFNLHGMPTARLGGADTGGYGLLDGLIIFANSTSDVTTLIASSYVRIIAPDSTGRAVGIATGAKSNTSNSFAANEDYCVIGKVQARTHSNLTGVRHYFGYGVYTSGASSGMADPATSTDPRLSITSGSNFVQINTGSGWTNTSVSVNDTDWWFEFSRVRGLMLTRVSVDGGITWTTVNTQTGITTGAGRYINVASICTDDATYTAASTNYLQLSRMVIARNPRN